MARGRVATAHLPIPRPCQHSAEVFQGPVPTGVLTIASGRFVPNHKHACRQRGIEQAEKQSEPSYRRRVASLPNLASELLTRPTRQMCGVAQVALFVTGGLGIPITPTHPNQRLRRPLPLGGAASSSARRGRMCDQNRLEFPQVNDCGERIVIDTARPWFSQARIADNPGRQSGMMG